MNSTTEATTNNTSDTTSPTQETSPNLAQAKIPSEMLAPYVGPNEFEV